jgi:hypothetical protein
LRGHGGAKFGEFRPKKKEENFAGAKIIARDSSDCNSEPLNRVPPKREEFVS